MNMNIDNLAEVIRNLSPVVPLNRALWAPEDVAEYMRVSRRTVAEKYSVLPDFPRPIRLPTSGKKPPLRWRAMDIINWVEKENR